VRHLATREFWRCYDALAVLASDLAGENFDVLKRAPPHPSLHFKRTGLFWSCRIGLSHRALGRIVGDDLVWFWIGSHAE
jgi:hypothetical protein